MSHIEEMLCEGETRLAYERGTPEFVAAVAQLETKFGGVDTNGWRSISTPQFNSIYDDQIISVVFRAIPFYLDRFKPAAAGRKYFWNKGWVYDKVYVMTKEEDCQLDYPAGGTPMFIGYLLNVYGQPGDEDLTRYKCLYFMHLDHEAVEQWAGQTLLKGEYSTFYAATFDTEDGNKLVRMKSYAYGDQGSFSDWDVIYLAHRKRSE